MAEGKINYDYPLFNLDQKCHQAIYSLRGDADYKIGETYDSLVWNDTEQDKPTKAEFDKALEDFNKKYDAAKYRRDRVASEEYPSIADITIALAEKEEGNSVAWDELSAKRTEIKNKYPTE